MTELHPMEVAVRQRLDALPDGWVSEAFRQAVLAEIRSAVPGVLLEQILSDSRAAEQASLERHDVEAAIASRLRYEGAVLVQGRYKPAAVDRGPIERELDACVHKVAQAAVGLNAPDFSHLEEIKRALQSRGLPVSAALEAGITAGSRCQSSVVPFAKDVAAFRGHRENRAIDPLTLVNLASDLCTRRPQFEEQIAETVKAIRAATAAA